MAALVSFYGVDADFLQFWNTKFLDSLAHHGYLVAVRYDDSYCFLTVELFSVIPVYAAKYIYYDFSFVGIDFVGNIRLLAEFRWYEDHAMFLQMFIEFVL